MKRAAILFVASAIALAGCVSTPREEGVPANGLPVAPADWAERAIPFGSGHDHANPAHHAGLSTPNFEVIGWDPLVTTHTGRTEGGHLCGGTGVAGDRRLSFVHAFWSDVAFVVADVTDGAAPKYIGELVMPRVQVYDLAVTPDAKYVVLGTSPLRALFGGTGGASDAAVDDAPFFRNACTGEVTRVRVAQGLPEAGYPSGVVLVDVSDPTAPEIVDYKAQPVIGAHSVFATLIDGTYFALASATNLLHQADYHYVFTILETPAGAKLQLETAYNPPPKDEHQAVISGHTDGWIQKHPITEQVLAYLAGWDNGLAILDITNPKVPLEIGRWNNFERGDADDDSGSIHGAYPLETLWDGKHYTLIGQEIEGHPKDTPTGVVYVLDTTDPANPTRVGAWTLPVDVEWSNRLQFSTHYFRTLDRTLFVTMYHGGMWAVDLSDVTTPRSVGVFIPDRVSPAPPKEERLGGDAALVLDVEVLANGDVVTWEVSSGVYVLRFDPMRPAPPIAEWPVP